MFDFFCDPLEDKIVYIIESRSFFGASLSLSTSTAFQSSISGLSTKRDTSTLNDICNILTILCYGNSIRLFAKHVVRIFYALTACLWIINLESVVVSCDCFHRFSNNFNIKWKVEV
jgi:hypothetical protein